MRRKNELPELLAPAGDFEALVAAVMAGADAVYVGGKSFGARAFAKNFDIEEIRRALSYCHLHGVKLYVTVNTLVYDREMESLGEYAEQLWRAGVDALICADLGVISEIRRRVPEFEIHASTQMSIHSTEGAEAAAQVGASRVVLARELPLADIRSVTEGSSVETEVFLHGALCVCHSGQCLFSSLVGGRSGNRGECAQPCRLPYNKGAYALSLKDLSLAEHIRELIDSGVASLKIEGRMKSPEYVYTVTGIYRRLLDEGRVANKDEIERLRRVFSRGGFTDAYFKGKGLGSMTGVRSEKDKMESRELEERKFLPERIPVRAEAKIRLGEPSELTLILKDRRAHAVGIPADVAKSAPLNADDVKARLSKMGNSDFSLSPEDITLSLDEGVNLPPSAINSLRREACEKLADFSRETAIASNTKSLDKIKEKKLVTALFYDPKVYAAISEEAKRIIDLPFLPLFRLDEYEGEVAGVALPPVIFDTEQGKIEKMLEKASLRGAKWALVENIGQIELARRFGLIPIGDFRLNISNSAARGEYQRLGVETTLLSPELTLPMARDIGGGVIVYGRIPLMLTERCFIKENFGCEKCGSAYLTDRTGAKFCLIREYEHRNLILNSTPTYMGDRMDKLRAAGLLHSHLVFTVENEREVRDVLLAFKNERPLPYAVRRMGKRD